MIQVAADDRVNDYRALVRAFGERARADEPLSRHTSFRIGGPADLFLQPQEPEELVRALRAARENGVPVMVLGGGSNLLVRDGGVRGLVIKMMKNFDGLEPLGEGRVHARAGEPGGRAAFRLAELGLGGLEFAVGIPGTVGGGVLTNAGAHGAEWGRRIEWVEGIESDGTPRRISKNKLAFSYRSVKLPHGFVVTGAMLQLAPEDPDRVLATTRGYMEDRRAKQPLNYPNAGCFFKNPPGAHAGKLIEDAGLKGFRLGDLEVSTKHANFIVNLGGGTARDALALVGEIQERVHRAHGVRVETEVMVVGEDLS